MMIPINQIITTYNDGNGPGINKLSKTYKISSWKIKQILVEHGVKVRSPSSTTISDTMLRALAIDLCDAEIARKVGLSKTTISSRLRHLGIVAKDVSKTNRRYSISLASINDLNSEIGAYWFGFLLADGHISTNRSRLTCNLQYRDYRHLMDLCGDLQTNKTPRKRYASVNGIKHSRASLSVNCRELCDFYLASGWRQFKLGDPNSLPESINCRHFIRGLWDGDGIVTRNRGNLRLGFVSPHIAIIDWLTGKITCTNSTQNINYHNKCYYRFWGNASSISIARWLYTDQIRSLNRKTTKIMGYL